MKGSLTCGGAQLLLRTLSILSVEDGMNYLVERRLWIRPPGRTRERSVNLEQPAFMTR